MSKKNHDSVFKIFKPGNKFPAISLSGTTCELDCAHCGKEYLKQMLAVSSPDGLFELCKKLVNQGATGALISGGCDETGMVMLDKYIGTLSKIKQELPFIINIHTGFITQEQARNIVKTGTDIASVDIVGHRDTIKNVYGLNHQPNDYKEALQTLADEGIKNIVPHICIGLDFGEIKGEFHAMDMIADIEPAAIVFIILIPTEGSKMENCSPPKIDEVVKVIKYARVKFRYTPIYLGCMRPRSAKYRKYSQELELKAISAGIDGIVLPSKETINYLNTNNIIFTIHNNCCAVGN
jgi:uncharacterized radical SAM superfamily protein